MLTGDGWPRSSESPAMCHAASVSSQEEIFLRCRMNMNSPRSSVRTELSDILRKPLCTEARRPCQLLGEHR